MGTFFWDALYVPLETIVLTIIVYLIYSEFECPAGSHYVNSMTACPETCAGPTEKCELPNVEGCACDKDLVLSNRQCVERTKCGCVMDGAYHEVWAIPSSKEQGSY